MRTKRGKGDASGVATFLVLLALFIIAYFVILPAEEREAILNPDKTDTDDGTPKGKAPTTGKILLSESPGPILSDKEGILSRKLGNIRLFLKTNEDIISMSKSLEVSKSYFDTEDQTLRFTEDQANQIKSMKLFFFVDQRKGTLQINLNGNTIYTGTVQSSEIPINLPKSLIQRNNELRFSVKQGGLLSNKYLLKDIYLKKTAYESNLQETRDIILTTPEYQDMTRAVITYFVSCSMVGEEGTLQVSLNNQLLTQKYLSCDTGQSFIEIDKRNFRTGTNTIKFELNKGDYILQDTYLDIELEHREYPRYTFTLTNEDFTEIFGECYENCAYDCDYECRTPLCARSCVDSCIMGCEEGITTLYMEFADNARKKAYITINEFQLNFETREREYYTEITPYLRRGVNTIKIIPRTDLNINLVEVFIE